MKFEPNTNTYSQRKKGRKEWALVISCQFFQQPVEYTSQLANQLLLHFNQILLEQLIDLDVVPVGVTFENAQLRRLRLTLNHHVYHDAALGREHIVRARVRIQNHDALLHPAVEVLGNSSRTCLDHVAGHLLQAMLQMLTEYFVWPVQIFDECLQCVQLPKHVFWRQAALSETKVRNMSSMSESILVVMVIGSKDTVIIIQLSITKSLILILKLIFLRNSI